MAVRIEIRISEADRNTKRIDETIARRRPTTRHQDDRAVVLSRYARSAQLFDPTGLAAHQLTGR